jgi:hypothetical protein
VPETHHLDGHHRATVEEIFRHPVSHNIQWHDVLSLLRAVGSAEEEHHGAVKVTIGGQTLNLHRPRHGSDLGEEQVVDLRRLLTHGGITPDQIGEPPHRAG